MDMHFFYLLGEAVGEKLAPCDLDGILAKLQIL